MIGLSGRGLADRHVANEKVTPNNFRTTTILRNELVHTDTPFTVRVRVARVCSGQDVASVSIKGWGLGARRANTYTVHLVEQKRCLYRVQPVTGHSAKQHSKSTHP